MAGSIGDLILQMLGKKDPKQQIIEDAMRQGGGGGGNPVPPAVPNDPAAPPAPAPDSTVVQPPVPESMKSPPDLAAGYMRLIERSQNAAQIDSGLTLMAAGFAQPQNQQALIQMAGREGAGGMGGFGIEEMMKLREAAAAEQDMSIRRAQLPALAKQYNLDDATITYLDRTDQLDEVVSALANPDTEVVESADKSKKLINSKSGETIKELSPKAPRATEFIARGDGSKVLVYSDDKTEVKTGKALTEIAAPARKQIYR